MQYAEYLIRLADQLDAEGKTEQADIIDKDFEEFLKLLEDGKLVMENTFSGSQRDPRLSYSNRGAEMPLCGIPGPQ